MSSLLRILKYSSLICPALKQRDTTQTASCCSTGVNIVPNWDKPSSTIRSGSGVRQIRREWEEGAPCSAKCSCICICIQISHERLDKQYKQSSSGWLIATRKCRIVFLVQLNMKLQPLSRPPSSPVTTYAETWWRFLWEMTGQRSGRCRAAELFWRSLAYSNRRQKRKYYYHDICDLLSN